MNYKGHRIVISVDPGFGGTGVCMFVGGKLYKFNNIKCKKEGTDRYVEIASKVAKNILSWLSDLRGAARLPLETYIKEVAIVIESPHAMGGVKGNASLGSGDVFKVAKLAGAIGVTSYLYIQSYLDCQELAFEERLAPVSISLYYPEVRTWKGQLSKDTTQKRVLRDVTYAMDYIIDNKYQLRPEYPDHVFDAAGLGMWFIKLEEEHKDENLKKIRQS